MPSRPYIVWHLAKEHNIPAADFLIIKVFDALFWSQDLMGMQQRMHFSLASIT